MGVLINPFALGAAPYYTGTLASDKSYFGASPALLYIHTVSTNLARADICEDWYYKDPGGSMTYWTRTYGAESIEVNFSGNVGTWIFYIQVNQLSTGAILFEASKSLNCIA